MENDKLNNCLLWSGTGRDEFPTTPASAGLRRGHTPGVLLDYCVRARHSEAAAACSWVEASVRNSAVFVEAEPKR
jgi:hypothetical protein